LIGAGGFASPSAPYNAAAAGELRGVRRNEAEALLQEAADVGQVLGGAGAPLDLDLVVGRIGRRAVRRAQRDRIERDLGERLGRRVIGWQQIAPLAVHLADQDRRQLAPEHDGAEVHAQRSVGQRERNGRFAGQCDGELGTLVQGPGDAAHPLRRRFPGAAAAAHAQGDAGARQGVRAGVEVGRLQTLDAATAQPEAAERAQLGDVAQIVGRRGLELDLDFRRHGACRHRAVHFSPIVGAPTLVRLRATRGRGA
jgi:hypothetical protein